MAIKFLPWFIWQEIFNNLPNLERLKYRTISKIFSKIALKGLIIGCRYDHILKDDKKYNIPKNIVRSIALSYISKSVWKRVEECFPEINNISLELNHPQGIILPKNVQPLIENILSAGISLELYCVDYGIMSYDDWIYKLNLTSLEICLNQLDPEKQLKIISRIQCPNLNKLGISYLYPSNNIMEVIARNHRKLKEIYLMYIANNKVNESFAIPKLESLTKAIVAAEITAFQNEKIKLILPDSCFLKKLNTFCIINLGSKAFNHKVKLNFPNIFELELFNARIKTELILSIFSNIKKLTYELGSIKESILDIRELNQLTKLTIVIPEHMLDQNEFYLESKTVLYLNIEGIRYLNKIFWKWISNNFPNIFSLSISGCRRPWNNYYYFDDKPLFIVSLVILYSNRNLPMKLINNIRKLYPNIKEIIVNSRGEIRKY